MSQSGDTQDSAQLSSRRPYSATVAAAERLAKAPRCTRRGATRFIRVLAEHELRRSYTSFPCPSHALCVASKHRACSPEPPKSRERAKAAHRAAARGPSSITTARRGAAREQVGGRKRTRTVASRHFSSRIHWSGGPFWHRSRALRAHNSRVSRALAKWGAATESIVVHVGDGTPELSTVPEKVRDLETF